MHNYAQADVGGFFCSNCVKVVSYSILHNYSQADVIALTCIIWENGGNKKALMKSDTACHWISSFERESHDDIIMATN